MSKYHVLIPSAGHGARMRSEVPKQYLMLNGKPILRHAIDIFESISELESIAVITAVNDVYWQPDLLLNCCKSRAITCGGETRAATVLNGLRAMAEYVKPDDWILVHDAARPGIDKHMIERLLASVSDADAGAILALPLADTLKRADAHASINETIPRDQLWQAQTPQMFKYSLLEQALSKHLSRHPTDEAQAIEWMGHRAKLVLGDLKNMKITYPHDLVAVAALMQATQN